MAQIRKRRKNICTCGKRMIIVYDDCIFCGGDEYYECPKCGKIYDSETGERL